MQQQAMRAVEPLVQDIGGKAACLFLKQAADVAWNDPHPRRHASDVEARVAQMYSDVGLDRPQPRRLHAGLFPHWLIVRGLGARSEEPTSELQSLMRISYAVFCLQNKNSKDK